MNTNHKAKRILCYGDSNIWGVNPETNNRHESDRCWTGILQDILREVLKLLKKDYIQELPT